MDDQASSESGNGEQSDDSEPQPDSQPDAGTEADVIGFPDQSVIRGKGAPDQEEREK